MFRIRRFGVIRTSNVFAVLYLLMTLLFVLPFIVILAVAGPMTVTDQFGQSTRVDVSPLFLLLIPLLYAVIGWIVTVIFCLLYNLAARITGGVEMQLTGDVPIVDRSDVAPA